jgi:hypothetical protein
VQPASLEPVTFSLCRRAASDGWHGRSSPRGVRQLRYGL